LSERSALDIEKARITSFFKFEGSKMEAPFAATVDLKTKSWHPVKRRLKRVWNVYVIDWLAGERKITQDADNEVFKRWLLELGL
jgi:hypothetical protein